MRSETQEPNFWNDSQHAAKISKKLSDFEEEINFWEGMKRELGELLEVAKLSEHDPKLRQEISEKIRDIKKKYEAEEFRIFLSGEYDKNDAYISIYAGAGGLDAQSWAEILLRMYQKYLEKKNYQVILQDISSGEEGGIKEATLEVGGKYAYGFLKGEKGVHRLVRISPFSAQKLRHTSFALVDIIPKIENFEDIEIPEEELRVDTFRSSGPGGQNVNKRESAVRVTHIPTGISASSQSERLQGINKEKSMEILRSKLYMLKIKKRKETLSELKGENISADWGNQIRSYVLHPYKMVKDHRTKVETSNVEAVLDGNLDEFIDEEVKQLN